MDNESKIKKVLFNEISFVIAGVGLVSSIMFWVMNPQQKLEIELVKLQSQIESNQTVVQALEKIKNNDFVEIQEKLRQLEERQLEIIKAIARLEAKL